MIIFKYKEEPAGEGKQLIKRPVADIYLKSSSGSWIRFYPYIDSGADVTLIPLSLGKLAGFSIDEEKIKEIGGIRGSVPVIYKHGHLKIGKHQLKAPLAWALIEEVPPLLGRESVFDLFHITFKQDENKIIFASTDRITP